MTARAAVVTLLAVVVATAGYLTTGRIRADRSVKTTAGAQSSATPTPTSGARASGASAPGTSASGMPGAGTSGAGRSGSGTTTTPPTSIGPSVAAAATRPPVARAAPAAPSLGPLPVAAKLGAATRAALAAPILGRSVHGLVEDAATGTVLLDRSATAPSPPASTAKLATATAVLAVISPQKRIATRIVAGTTPGQVVLVGGGDPTLSAAPTGHGSLYPGAARLSSLAAAAKKASARAITSIVVDTSLYSGPVLGPGWGSADVPSTYGAAIQALMVDGGRPAAGGELRSAHPALEAGRALARLLGRPALPVRAGHARTGARVLGTVYSAPVLNLVEQALLYSDNVIAETLGRQVALTEHEPASFAGAVLAIRAALASVGFRVPTTLADASGLSERDRLSPAVLAALLRFDAGSAHPALNQIVSALPVAGWEGTLAQRYRRSGASAAGRVRAKTGTLTGVVALAGLVRDRSGRLLVFAFIADRVPNGATLAAEAALDRVAASFTACGCR